MSNLSKAIIDAQNKVLEEEEKLNNAIKNKEPQDKINSLAKNLEKAKLAAKKAEEQEASREPFNSQPSYSIMPESSDEYDYLNNSASADSLDSPKSPDSPKSLELSRPQSTPSFQALPDTKLSLQEQISSNKFKATPDTATTAQMLQKANVSPTSKAISAVNVTVKNSIASKETVPGANVADAPSEAEAMVQEQIQKAEELAKHLAPTQLGAEFYEQLIKDSKKLYEDRQARNDWLEVIEKISNGLIQWAAAKAGGDKVDMSNLRLQYSDWDAKTANAFKKYIADRDEILGKLNKENQAVEAYNQQLDKVQDLRVKLANLRDARKREQAELELQREKMKLDQAARDADRAVDWARLNQQERLQRESLRLEQEAKKANREIDWARLNMQKQRDEQEREDRLRAEKENEEGQLKEAKYKESTEQRQRIANATKALSSVAEKKDKEAVRAAIPYLLSAGIEPELVNKLEENKFFGPDYNQDVYREISEALSKKSAVISGGPEQPQSSKAQDKDFVRAYKLNGKVIAVYSDNSTKVIGSVPPDNTSK